MSKSWWDEPSIAEVKENPEEYVQEIIENEDDSNIIEMWNEYCDDIKYYDDHIFYMSELDELYGDMQLSEFLGKLDDFNIQHDYFKEGIYGLKSIACHELADHVDYRDLAEWLLENRATFGDSDLEDLYEMLDSEEDEENEEEGGDEK